MAAKGPSRKGARGRKTSPESGQESGWRIILTGKSGGGKSATGNTVLGREEFPSTLSAKSTTQECRKETGNWKGQEFLLIDTPAIFESKTRKKKEERKKCKKLSRPGAHALLFVTQVGRFTAEDGEAARRVQKVFGAEAWRHTIILFTRKEDLGGMPLEDYLAQSGNEALRQLVGRCENRICAFNNRAVGAEREQQVSQLMQLVQGLVQENGYLKKKSKFGKLFSCSAS